jgi:hypothetical protein
MQSSTLPIIIQDYPCGSGKTSRMLEGFKLSSKYLVVVPYLSEVLRVLEGSKGVLFKQPIAEGSSSGRKTDNLEELLISGENIVTTHKLYGSIVKMARQGLLKDYDIIIDEVPEVCKSVASKSKYSIRHFYIDKGFVDIQGNGLVLPTEKWRQYIDIVSDTLDPRIFSYAETGCLYLLGEHMFIWAMPKELLTAGRSVTIMTYKSQGSMLLSYLQKLNCPHVVQSDPEGENAFRKSARSLIELRDIPSIRRLELSYSGQERGKSRSSYYSKVSSALKNLKGRSLKTVPADEILITCKKDLWFKHGSNDPAPGAPSSFSKGSKMFNANWIANTTRGTNDYSRCSTLIYLYDQHINPLIGQWLNESSRSFNDAYALTELIQWVWRSRIRNGEPIVLYLPSPRMRAIFSDWLEGDDLIGLPEAQLAA